jgi:uncharacterized protein
VRAPAIDVNEAPGTPLTAVLLHPHPDMGGDRFNHVIDALYHALPKGGYTAARFDFSTSDIATASAEAAAVIDQLGATPIALVGYSFGAGVAVHVADARLVGWLLVAPYISGAVGAVAVDPRPKLVLVAEHDQWCPPSRLGPLAADWANTTVTTLAGTDHFLVGGTDTVVDAALTWLDDLSDRGR